MSGGLFLLMLNLSFKTISASWDDHMKSFIWPYVLRVKDVQFMAGNNVGKLLRNVDKSESTLKSIQKSVSPEVSEEIRTKLKSLNWQDAEEIYSRSLRIVANEQARRMAVFGVNDVRTFFIISTVSTDDLIN
jgi:hypothetical protein